MADKKVVATRVKRTGESKRVESVERVKGTSSKAQEQAAKPRASRKQTDVGGAPRKEPVLSKFPKDTATRPAAKGLSSKVKVGQAVASPKNLMASQGGLKEGSKVTRTKTVSRREKELDDKKAKHESRSLSRAKPLVRERMRTRTISPREEQASPKSLRIKEPKDEKDDYEDETFEDYESDFEEDEEEETSGASSTQDEQQPQQSEHKPREMVSLPEPPAKPISALSRSNDQKRTKVARRESRGESPVEETRPRGLGEEENGVASEMKAIAPVIGEKATIAKKAALSKSFPQQQQEQKRQLKENNNAGQSGQQAAVSAAPLPEDRDNQAPIHTLATQQIKMLKMMRLDVVSCGAVDISPTTLATTKQNNAKSASDETKSSCEEKWTQHPAMQNDEEVGGGSSSAAEQQVEVSEKVAAALKRASDKVELSELLREKSHFFERAVENVGLGGEVRNLAKEGTKFAARSGAINSRPPKMLHFAEPARLISVHAWQEGDESAGELLFVWTILADTEHPFYVLGCRGRVTCICVPSTAPSLVLAGTQDGTVCLWDLQEPASNHSTMLLGSQTLVVRSSAFTTALLKSSHVFAVRGLCSVAGGEQVASVDQEGEMAVWSVVWASGGHPDSVERGCHLVRGAQRNLRAELADGESAEVTDVVSSAERLLVAFDTALVVAFSPLSSVGRIKKYPPTRGPILGETMLAINPRLKNTFAVLDGFGDVSVFDAKHSRPLWRLAAHAAILSWASSGLLLLHADRTRLSLWSPPTVTGEQTATHLASCQLHSKVDQVTASISTDNVVLTTCDGELVSISIRRDLSAASARK